MLHSKWLTYEIQCVNCSLAEEEFQVETSCVAVDFSIGRDTYSFIWDSIKDKEIGVLGKYCKRWQFEGPVFLKVT